MTHGELVLKAEKWLRDQGCGVVFRDPFKALTNNSEQPDAIGFRSSISILIECKASRADFLADKGKSFRASPDKGMGDWRFYLCPPGVIKIEDLPEGWGLLEAAGKRINKTHGVPPNCRWHTPPLAGNKQCELQLMYSALRRMEIRGHLKQIYQPLSEIEQTA